MPATNPTETQEPEVAVVPPAGDTFIRGAGVDWRVWVLIGIGVAAALTALVLFSPRLHPGPPSPVCGLAQRLPARATLCP